NYSLCSWAGFRWTQPWRSLLLSGRRRRRALLRVQNRSKQQCNRNRNKNTLHRRKGWKLKLRAQKSTFGFGFASGLFRTQLTRYMLPAFKSGDESKQFAAFIIEPFRREAPARSGTISQRFRRQSPYPSFSRIH